MKTIYVSTPNSLNNISLKLQQRDWDFSREIPRNWKNKKKLLFLLQRSQIFRLEMLSLLLMFYRHFLRDSVIVQHSLGEGVCL